MHYTSEDGAAVRLPFTGTGVTVYGERFADQGAVEVFLDGTSQGIVDTSLPQGSPRQAAQAIFTSPALDRGPHVVELIKRSGAYATIDAFEIR